EEEEEEDEEEEEEEEVEAEGGDEKEEEEEEEEEEPEGDGNPPETPPEPAMRPRVGLHPESPQRLSRVLQRLQELGLAQRCLRVPPRPASPRELRACHT
ncbi:HDAC6 deacetylase, partial [Atrichornis clamosus]|nr:HDAC6 deacetylase [Atrichornis clamosus]